MGQLKALQWFDFLQISHATFETNCKQVVDLIHLTGANYTELGHIIKECSRRNMLLSHLFFTIVFARREANMAAHKLASTAIVLDDPHDYHTIPPCIVETIFKEKQLIFSNKKTKINSKNNFKIMN